jgi:DNA-binding protein H-NS
MECTCDERLSIRNSFAWQARTGETLKSDFEKMSLEELWLLRDEVTEVLRRRITEEKRELEWRLTLLRGNLPAENVGPSARRRTHPKVLPKYRNPAEPAETWSGRGKRPKWVIAQLLSGKKLEDLAV